MLFLELSIFSSFTSHPMWVMTSLAKLLFLDMLFLGVLFLAHSKFKISCCTFFNTPSQQERLPLKPDPVTLECSTCNTSARSTLLQQHLEQKKLPTDQSIGLGTYSDAEALPAADKCSLSNICATATSPCISHHCTPLCAT